MGMFDQYLPNWLPDDPNENAATRQGLLSLGATMLANRGGFGESLGNGLLAGANGYNTALTNQSKKALSAAELQKTNLETQKLQTAIDQPMQLAKIASSVYGNTGGAVQPVSALPQVGQPRPQVKQAPAPMGGANFDMGYGNDTPEAMPIMPQQDAPQQATPAPAAATGGADQYQTQLMLAQAYYKAGYAAEGDKAMERAKGLKSMLKEQAVRTVNGQRVLTNVYDDGRTEQVNGFAPDQEKLNFQNTGGSTMALDPFTGKPVNTIKNSVSPDAVLVSETTRRGQNMTAATAAANAAASDQAPITGGAIDNAAARYNFDGTLPPMGMGKNAAAGRSAILNRAAELKTGVDPTQQRQDQITNKSDLSTQASAVRSFSTGKDGQAIQSANTALNHLETIRHLAQAQKSGDMRAFNQAARALGAQFGSAAPTNLNAALIMVAPEVSKAVIGAGGTGHERDEAQKALNPNGSPDQIIGATETMQELFGGRLTEARRTYERTTKKKDFDSLLSPAAQNVIGKAAPKVQDVKDLPKKDAPTAAYADKDKEARYQEYLRSQKK